MYAGDVTWLLADAQMHYSTLHACSCRHLDVLEDFEEPKHSKSPEDPDSCKAFAGDIEYLQANGLVSKATSTVSNPVSSELLLSKSSRVN